MEIIFNLENSDYIALCDLLKVTGLVSSGGDAKLLINDGLILRNGKEETRKKAKIIKNEIIEYNDKKIIVKSGFNL